MNSLGYFMASHNFNSLATLCQQIWSLDIHDICPFKGGRNSKTYLINHNLVLKCYPSLKRMQNEFKSLSLLHKNKLCHLPTPIKNNSKHFMALYSYIPGEKITHIRDWMIKDAIHFLTQLSSLKIHSTSEIIPSASEACFCINELEKAIISRLKALASIKTGTTTKKLTLYVNDELDPGFKFILKNTLKTAKQMGINACQPIAIEDRILSPSDFGFHNALQFNKKIFYLDFEYFGWDDPSKTLSDFLLHPGMNMTPSQRTLFYQQMLANLNHQPSLSHRIQLIWPLQAINWCFILLNTFLPARNQYHVENTSASNLIQLQNLQLKKSKNLLNYILLNYHQPYPQFSGTPS